jgi:hypothetical protein
MSARIWFASVTAAAIALGWSANGQTNLLTLVSNGPTATRLNIVFLSEGYTTNDLAHFPSDARVMLDRMLTTAPLSEYSNYFNAFAISVPSAQSGSDHYTPTTNLVDTFFNSTYDSSGIQRLITIDSTGRSRANSLLARFVPEYDLAAIVVNDTVYGGSGGSILISSINSSSPEIATHEMGHTFAGLGDEYSYAGSTPSETPNTTALTNFADIRWNVWIPNGTPIPTPDVASNYSVVGLFRGAAYSTNYFRPKHNCKMQTLGVVFCEVCSEALVKTVYRKTSAIESYAPATNNPVKLTNGLANAFGVTNLVPSTHSLKVQWFTNGVAVAGATSTVFAVNGFDLPATGTNVIRVDVTDPTALVRSAPTNMMTSSLTWRENFVLALPSLSILNTSAQTTLSWPATAAGFYLERASTLSNAGAWTPLLLISNQAGLVISPTNAQGFYRLHRP